MSIAFSSRQSAAAGLSEAISRYALVLLLVPLLALADDPQPVDLVRGATDSVLAELDAAPGIRNDPVKLTRVIQDHIAPQVDLAALSRLTLGKHWQRATQEQREVFVMREFGGLKFREIAVAMSVSENTVKSRMRYALEALRGHLADYRDHSFDREEEAEKPSAKSGII